MKAIEGKQKILTVYLNQNFYGNQSYGVAAAAKGYFGADSLKDLTLAQAAILAAIPQSPTAFDLVKNAIVETEREGRGGPRRPGRRPDRDPPQPGPRRDEAATAC